MFIENWLRKKIYKHKTLVAAQKEIWQLEIQLLAQQDFLEEAEIKKSQFELEVNQLTAGIKKLDSSTKYDDRITKKELLDDLKPWQEKLEQQKMEIKKSQVMIEGGQSGDKMIMGIEPQILQLRNQMALIRERF